MNHVRPVLDFQWCLDRAAVFMELEPPFVLALRGFFTVGGNARGVFDDAIIIVDDVHFKTFNGNTDPQNFESGIASIKAPQLLNFAPGIHNRTKEKRKQYEAFIQNSEFEVYRDGSDVLEKGWFGLNLHRAGNFETLSDGCQTIWKPQWDEFFYTMHDVLTDHELNDFNYLLLEA